MIRPSYQQGFARSAGESVNPDAWRGLLAAWVPSLGNTGLSLRDVGPYRQSHATISGATWATNSSSKERLSLEYSSDFTQINSTFINSRIAGSSNLYFGAWVKANSNATWGTIQKTWPSTATQRHLHLGFDNTSQKVSIYIQTTSGQIGPVIETNTLTLGEWAFYEVLFTGGRLYLFRDGVETGSNIAAAGTIQSGVTQTWEFGRKLSTSTQYWDGCIGAAFLSLRDDRPKNLYLDPLAPFQKRRRVLGFEVVGGGGATEFPFELFHQTALGV